MRKFWNYSLQWSVLFPVNPNTFCFKEVEFRLPRFYLGGLSSRFSLHPLYLLLLTSWSAKLKEKLQCSVTYPSGNTVDWIELPSPLPKLLSQISAHPVHHFLWKTVQCNYKVCENWVVVAVSCLRVHSWSWQNNLAIWTPNETQQH